MQTPILTRLGIASVALAGSLLLPSCSKTQPTPTTTVIVQAPAAPAATAGQEKATVSIDEAKQEAEDAAPARKSKPKSEPTDRDVEDAVPARKSSASGKSESKLMDFYDRLPARHFVMFQNGNRRALLKRKGVIVDYKKNFIEIPGSADPKDGDLRMLQMTLFPNGDEPWCAVSRIVWPDGNTPGALDFYYDSSDGGALRKAADGFFPYKLSNVKFKGVDGEGGGYENAFLPRKGLDIDINTFLESEYSGPIYRYNRNFRVGEPAFVKIQ